MIPVIGLLRVPSPLSAIFFGFTAALAIRLAMAEVLVRQDTPKALRRAIRLQAPAPAEEVVRRLADHDPAHARRYIEQLVQTLNPRSSASWIELGLEDEAEGDLAGAERRLLEAARVDRQYLPAWTLANFFFRQRIPERFWPWAQRAAALSADRLADSDLVPLLRLCDEVESDPERMLARVGDTHRMRTAYLRFLIVENRLDAARRVALAMGRDRSNDPYLADLADREIRAENADGAIALWKASMDLPPIDPAAGSPLANGDLARAPLNLGFDWRLPQTEGVESIWKPSQLIFRIDGTQPERCVLLEQTVFLNGRRFCLRFDYTTGALPARGLRWGLNQDEGSEILSSDHWREGTFDLPRRRGLASLRLFYRREPGTTRAEQSIEIRHLRLEEVPETRGAP